MTIRPARSRPWLALPTFALAGTLLAGCALTPPDSPRPALEQLPDFDARQQRLTFVSDEDRHIMLGVLRHRDATLRMALLSPQGQRLLTLVQDDDGARFLPGASFQPPFSAEWLAGRLAWDLWSNAALHQAFSGTDWRLEIRAGQRNIYRGDTLIARLSGEADCRLIDDRESGYRLYIATLDDAFDDNPRAPDTCPTP
ncbi:MAG: DUF3261 domain-containing protein [Halomonas sp.]|nr:DUF3261 domain-containing protein [Halomonas sp.]MDN6298200.1 DUF3261 domain-containing protein [Halomonas sp.]MDN6314979.1 DUF3261 domain-containing protein [Halomonas sp.]MDN6336786.1 DUF3261 domain-containing protein [Halomonas sp.]